MDEAGRGVLTLERGVWEALVLQHLAAHTDRLVARDDFALACRCPAPRPALQAGDDHNARETCSPRWRQVTARLLVAHVRQVAARCGDCAFVTHLDRGQFLTLHV